LSPWWETDSQARSHRVRTQLSLKQAGWGGFKKAQRGDGLSAKWEVWALEKKLRADSGTSVCRNATAKFFRTDGLCRRPDLRKGIVQGERGIEPAWPEESFKPPPVFFFFVLFVLLWLRELTALLPDVEFDLKRRKKKSRRRKKKGKGAGGGPGGTRPIRKLFSCKGGPTGHAVAFLPLTNIAENF